MLNIGKWKSGTSLLCCLFSCLLQAQQTGNPPKPNIILIVADDLGYGDLGLYGGKTPVPQLSAMAREGMRFTDFHTNGAVCSPTRAALLTGRYQQRMGIEIPLNETDLGLGDEKAKGEITIAQYLHDAGYYTGIVGKWHLGRSAAQSPVNYGFDDFWGGLHGSSDYISKVTTGGNYDWWHNKERVQEAGYNTTLITEHALQFLNDHKQQPFFLYIAHNAIHFPWQTPSDTASRKQGSHYGDVNGVYNKLGQHAPAEVSHVISIMIQELDNSVGRVMQKLKELKLDKNTLVFFCSDNGGIVSYKGGYSMISSNKPFRGGKGNVYEGGHRVPAIAWWPGRIKAGQVSDQTIMTMDIAPTIMELAGIDQPSANSLNKIDGHSISNLLFHNKHLSPRKLFWRHRSGYAVRDDQWKLVLNEKDPPELYDLANDPGESKNIASKHASLVEQLIQDLETWKQDVYKPKQ
jgi:arylsulfatase A-like enzyme